MAQWFADFADSNNGRYVFRWDNAEAYAMLVEATENERVRYRWEDGPKDEYFEFMVKQDEVTGGTALIITDFADKDDIEGQKRLWDSQIKILQERLGG